MNHPKFHALSSFKQLCFPPGQMHLETGKMNSGLNHFDKKVPQKICYLLKYVILHNSVNILLVLFWVRLQRSKKELLFFCHLIWTERENFVRTVSVYLQFLLWMQYACTDIVCTGITDQKANQKSSTSETQPLKVHRCFTLLLELLVKFSKLAKE